jgi:hypothetical protein
MVEEHPEDTAPDSLRRKTFEAPQDEATFTGSFSLAEEAHPSAVSEPQKNYLSPPVRESRSEAEILDTFGRSATGASAEMLVELERQMFLKTEEALAFDSWANIIRETRPDKADLIIAHERIIFNGGDPGPLDEGESALELVAHGEPGGPFPSDTAPALDAQALGDDSLADKAEAEIVDASGAGEEPPARVPSEPEEEMGHGGDTDSGMDSDARPGEPPKSAPGLADTVLADDTWPLAQTSTDQVAVGVAVGPAPVGTSSVWPLLATWGAVLVPFVAVTAGAFLASLGLGISESLAVVGGAALVVGLIIAAIARQAALHRGSSFSVGAGTFGPHGATATGALLIPLRSVVIAGLAWLAGTVATGIVGAAGWGPFEPWSVRAITAGVVVVLVVVPAVVGGLTLRVALWGSAALGLVGSVAVVWLMFSELSSRVEWAWSADTLSVLGAFSLLVAGGVVVLATVSGDVARVTASGRVRGLGAVSALAAVVPLAMVTLAVSWVAGNSATWGAALSDNALLALLSLAPSWYPIPAILTLAVPFVGLATLALYSLGASIPRRTGPERAVAVQDTTVTHRGVLALGGVLVSALLALAIVFDLDGTSLLPDVLYPLGVIAAAWAGALAGDAAVRSWGEERETPALRPAPLLAMLAAVGLGLGLVKPDISWLEWQGYLFPILEDLGVIDLTVAQPGVVVALVVSAVVTVIATMATPKHSRVSR